MAPLRGLWQRRGARRPVFPWDPLALPAGPDHPPTIGSLRLASHDGDGEAFRGQFLVSPDLTTGHFLLYFMTSHRSGGPILADMADRSGRSK